MNAIGCELYLNSHTHKNIYNELKLYKEEIKNELQLELEWNLLDNDSKIRTYFYKNINIEDKNNCNIYFDWFLENGENFKNVFSKYITQILDKDYNGLVFPKNIKKTNIINIANENEELSFIEGKERFIQHKTKERDSKVAKEVKRLRLEKDGILKCDVCNFDFLQTYGELGEGFIEAHHTIPISEIKTERETKLSEIALVCSNCHRMLHRGDKLLSISELKKIIESKKE